jgi:hypothetical protein
MGSQRHALSLWDVDADGETRRPWRSLQRSTGAGCIGGSASSAAAWRWCWSSLLSCPRLESTARGRYRDHDGNLIVEEVAVVTGYGKGGDYTGSRQRFLQWLIDAKAKWEQESIGFEFEGDLWYL